MRGWGMSQAFQAGAAAGGLSEPKKKILWHLKVAGEAGLEELANVLGISKTAVHKHLVALEQRNLVESTRVVRGVGRPRLMYRLASSSEALFPRSYASMALCALQFIERELGREAVRRVLRERQSELFKRYYERLGHLEFEDRVKELARLRDEEGYMAEVRKGRSGEFVLYEHNCPVIQVAQKYWEACSAEAELFENLLGAKVTTTHRAAKGDAVCKFVIRARGEMFAS